MSLSTGISSSRGAASCRYYCHQCERAVSLGPSAPDISCPICHGGFLEEIESPLPNLNPFVFEPSLLSPFPSVLSSSSAAAFSLPNDLEIRHPRDLHGLFAPPPSAASGGVPVPFNALTFLQNHILELLASGANIQIALEDGNGSRFVGGNVGDFALGPGLEQILQQLMENDPNRHGTPPAAKSAIASLPDVEITPELVRSNEAQCAVCMDNFEVGDKAKEMPCKHIYHKDCICPWLELHNSCPVCRYELPTVDPDYDQRRKETTDVPSAAATTEARHPDSAGGSSSSTSVGHDSPGQPVRGRRFRISLPWPFRGFGSQTEDSNANRQSGNQGDGRSEPQDEDLD